MQMDIAILESDIRKLSKEKTTLEAEIRKAKQDSDRLRVFLDEKRLRFQKVERDIFSKQEEHKSLKRKIYSAST